MKEPLVEVTHPVPPLRLRRPETISLSKMKPGQSLTTDRNGMMAMVQWGHRHEIEVVVRRIGKNKWRVWRA